MTSQLLRLASICVAVTLGATSVMRAAQHPAGRTGIHTCSLLTAAEIEKALGGKDPFVMGPPREEELPGGGAWDCSYSSAIFQVDPFDWATLEHDAKSHPGDWKPLSGVGDAAYLNMNAAPDSVGLYVQAGRHAVSVLIHGARHPTDTPEKRRAAAIALAQALIAKLH